MPLPLIVGICGASGVIYEVETLKILKKLGQPTHLIVSSAGAKNLSLETDYSLE